MSTTNISELSPELADMLPDEVRALIDAEREARAEQIERLNQVIAKKRSEAVTARTASGIEEVWMQCEEAYLGIDDANRHEFAGAKWAKPTNMSGPVTTSRIDRGDEVRSTVYVPITARYVDAGAAKLAEILLPLDDKAFSIEPTPVPELVKLKDDTRPLAHPETGEPLTREAIGLPSKPEMPGQAQGPQQGAQPLTVKDLVEQELGEAKDRAKAAEKRINDWMVEANHAAETRKVIHDAARIGSGVLKGPFPDLRSAKAMRRTPTGTELQIVEKVKPSEKWIDVWNLFPDPACGEDIHSGDYLFERDFISARTLKKLRRQPGYIKDQIDEVLKEGPGNCNIEGRNPNVKTTDGRYEIWYFYGTITRKDLELVEAPGVDALPEDLEDAYAILTLVNDRVIRATINPLESGDFPYHVFRWRRRAGSWAGVGVAEQLRTAQRMVNAATRAMLNNAGKSAGSQTVLDRGAVVPADGSWTITPDKLWFKSPDATMDDVRKAFALFQIPNITAPLLTIIEYALRLAEESTSIPLISQGQTGPTTPETFGATQLQNNNANTLLRSIGYSFDDDLTCRLVDQYYEWLLLDPSVPDEEKGDWQINAHGSVALVERAIQDQTLAQLVGLSVNPAFGVNPAKVFEEFLKSKRIDPRGVKFTEEELAQQAQAQPAPAPAVQAAQIRAQTELQKAQLQEQSDLQIAQLEASIERERIARDTDRDAVYVQAETQRTEGEYGLRLRELEMKLQLAQLDYAAKHSMQLEDVKARLADTAMKLRVQKELSAESNARQALKPPTEPAGRAANGKAYQQ